MITSTETNNEAASAGTGVKSVLISGASGLVGRALCSELERRGQTATRLVRKTPASNEVAWDPAAGTIDAASIEADAVVHLAGENIAEGRWTRSKMAAIRESRVRGTRLLAESLAALETPPKALVSASAVGFYGDRGNEVMTESSTPGSGFLADVCREWERATEPAELAGIRVVHLRIGVVLSREGGALKKMLLPFQLGAGGRLGSGKQYMSWILLDDLVGAVCRAVDDDTLSGAVNATAPEPVTNAEYTRALGRVLGRPTFAAMPAFAARLALGKMADELLLASIRVEPEVLDRIGFEFRAPDVETALRIALGKAS